MYTGDDFNYAELIEGDERGHSDALLGIFDAIAPAASSRSSGLPRAIKRDLASCLRRRSVVAAYLHGADRYYRRNRVPGLFERTAESLHMIGGQQCARSLQHLAELFRLADAARVLRDPDLAAERMAS